MRIMLALAAFLLSPALLEAQIPDLVGKRIRAKLGGANGPWSEGFVVENFGDSLTMRLAGTRTDIRIDTSNVALQQANGHDNAGGFARGFVIGGLVTIAFMASIAEFNQGGLEGVLYLVFPPLGGIVGGAVGVGTASERWTPISTGRPTCGGWRNLNADGSTAPIVVRSQRNRTRGAIIWGAALGGIGLIGGLTDSELPRGDIPGVVIGNAAVGAVIGSIWGPRQKVVVNPACPTG